MAFEPRRARILVVDDDPFVLELLTTRLELAGYQTFSARNGYEALDRLANVSPAGMILDINMPRLDGFGVLRSMKSVTSARIPTMVLTARNQPEDVRTALQLGAVDYLTKPFDDRQLLVRVARLLRGNCKPDKPVSAALI